MTPSEIRAYVPNSAYLDQKQEIACPRFYEDFALLEPGQHYQVLASRGLTLKPDYKLRIPPSEIDFLERNLLHAEIIAVKTEEGILLVLTDLLSSTGLLPVILPHGDPGAVAYAVACIGENKIRLSPSVLASASPSKDAESIYAHLSETLSLCDRVLTPDPDRDFRLHCAHIAMLAGCRANVIDLPIGHYPLHAGDHARWTAFLLCVFLSLRGDSAKGSRLSLEHADLQEFQIRLSHQSEHQRKTPVTDTLYRFLTLPAFSKYVLTNERDRFVIEARLRRRTTDGTLGAPIFGETQETLVIEIILENAS
jgi:hypothetical protein